MRPVPPPAISDDVVAESLRLARANQVPGQTKEQTQLIAQGIQKGMAEFKRAQKARQRAADKARKQQRRQQTQTTDLPSESAEINDERSDEGLDTARGHTLAWWLLGASWLLFAALAGYYWLQLPNCHI